MTDDDSGVLSYDREALAAMRARHSNNCLGGLMAYDLRDPVCGQVAMRYMGEERFTDGHVLKARDFQSPSGGPMHAGELVRCGACKRVIQIAPNHLGVLVIQYAAGTGVREIF